MFLKLFEGANDAVWRWRHLPPSSSASLRRRKDKLRIPYADPLFIYSFIFSFSNSKILFCKYLLSTCYVLMPISLATQKYLLTQGQSRVERQELHRRVIVAPDSISWGPDLLI